MDIATGQGTHRLAVLIDAENASHKIIDVLLKEVAKYGTANVKRIYGDWTTQQLSGWKDKLHRFSIQPIQQFRYTEGKNSTDSALIIDAMDLLYTDHFDAFCLVSSDSDFTRLASRIREAGLTVYGFGENKTPKAFVAACDKFIYTEILTEADPALAKEVAATPKQASNGKPDKDLLKLLRDAYDAIADDSGWTHLGPLGSQLTKLSPSFDARNYGYKKLSELVQAVELFEIKKAGSHFRLRLRESKN